MTVELIGDRGVLEQGEPELGLRYIAHTSRLRVPTRRPIVGDDDLGVDEGRIFPDADPGVEQRVVVVLERGGRDAAVRVVETTSRTRHAAPAGIDDVAIIRGSPMYGFVMSSLDAASRTSRSRAQCTAASREAGS